MDYEWPSSYIRLVWVYRLNCLVNIIRYHICCFYSLIWFVFCIFFFALEQNHQLSPSLWIFISFPFFSWFLVGNNTTYRWILFFLVFCRPIYYRKNSKLRSNEWWYTNGLNSTVWSEFSFDFSSVML